MNTYYIAGFPVSDELRHFGILGMHWGERRFQNPDGTYTPAGKERYRKTGAERRAERVEWNRQKRLQKYEESVARGDDLIGKGRTAGGAIARGVARELAIIGGTAAADILLRNVLASYSIKTLFSDPRTSAALMVGQECVKTITTGIGAGLTIDNVVKTAKEYRDIRRAERRLYGEDRKNLTNNSKG